MTIMNYQNQDMRFCKHCRKSWRGEPEVCSAGSGEERCDDRRDWTLALQEFQEQERLIEECYAAGMTIIETMKTYREVFDCSLGDAKRRVTSHPCFALIVQAAEPLHDDAIAGLSKNSAEPQCESPVKDFLSRLPDRFRWTLHNLIAHPISEILYQIGLEDLGNRIHDATVPIHQPGKGRG